MPAQPQQFQLHPRNPSKCLHRPIRNIRIILRMKHHDLRSTNFRRVIDRVIKLPAAQLLPIPIRQPIPLPKRRPNVSGVTRIRSLLLLLPRKNPPIHHRTIRHHLLNPRIKRNKNRRRPAKTPPNHKHVIHLHPKPPPKRQPPKPPPPPPKPTPKCQRGAPFQKPPRHSPKPRDTADKTPN